MALSHEQRIVNLISNNCTSHLNIETENNLFILLANIMTLIQPGHYQNIKRYAERHEKNDNLSN